MDRAFAVEILKAVACCSVTELYCTDCPLYEREEKKCRPWQDEEVVEAVRVLNKRSDNK